jgi:hypothetical protein
MARGNVGKLHKSSVPGIATLTISTSAGGLEVRSRQQQANFIEVIQDAMMC